jgi:uncharacterized protein YhbP (UPF0306 family)
MTKTERLIKQYLPTVNIMQLATSYNNMPWACSLHYYSDKDLNIYWLSTVDRRHSQDINSNPNVAMAIKVHEDSLEEDFVIGLSFEGTAEVLNGSIDASILKGFAKKLGADNKFMNDVAAGKNPHKLYKFKPSKIVLFDSKNFPKVPRQEWLINL